MPISPPQSAICRVIMQILLRDVYTMGHVPVSSRGSSCQPEGADKEGDHRGGSAASPGGVLTLAQAAEQARVSRPRPTATSRPRRPCSSSWRRSRPASPRWRRRSGTSATTSTSRGACAPARHVRPGRARQRRCTSGGRCGCTRTPGCGATAPVATTAPRSARAGGCGGSTRSWSRSRTSPTSDGDACGPPSPSTLGIDAIVVMKDVCRLDDDEALAVLRWAATVLLRAGLEEGRAPASVR